MAEMSLSEMRTKIRRKGFKISEWHNASTGQYKAFASSGPGGMDIGTIGTTKRQALFSIYEEVCG